jgi:segregation and condensation protein B
MNEPTEGQPATPSETAKRIVEALLFAAPQPLDRDAIAKRLPEGSDIDALIAALEAEYAARGVNLVRVAGRFALRTAPDLGAVLEIEVPVKRKLSRAAIETLAIIAYHQPVTRAEVEEIRGVALSKGTLDALMESGWVKPKGHRESPGRPATWVTTEAFLSQFGLDKLADLPNREELKALGLIDARAAVSAYREMEADMQDGAEVAEDEPLIEPQPGEGGDDQADAPIDRPQDAA